MTILREDECFEEERGDKREKVYDEEAAQERDTWIAGVIARHCEQAGLIQPDDDFSWEWHQELDLELDAAIQAEAQAEAAARQTPPSPAAAAS